MHVQPIASALLYYNANESCKTVRACVLYQRTGLGAVQYEAPVAVARERDGVDRLQGDGLPFVRPLAHNLPSNRGKRKVTSSFA